MTESPRTRRTRTRRRRIVRRRRRTAAFAIGVMFIAAGLVGRVVQLGAVQPDAYVERGKEQRERSIELAAMRGTIYDRNGDALVVSVPGRTIAVDPTVVVDRARTADVLSEELDLPRGQVVDLLEEPDTRYVRIALQVEPEIAERLLAADLPGIVVEDEPRRLSAADGLGAAVLGRLDSFGDVAISGLEKLFDEDLAPRPGEKVVERGVTGATIPGSERIVSSAEDGDDLYLTLDRALQYQAEMAIREQVDAVGAEGGTVVLGRPATGEILAMASVGRDSEGELTGDAVNLAIRAYEPGSVMKAVTVAAAIDLGLVNGDTTFVVPDSITLYDRTVRDSHSHPTEIMTVDQIVKESSNVGTIKIAQEVGESALTAYLHKFGFGSTSALGLLKEQSGTVKTEWNGTDIASIPIGQSVTVTPVQMWSAYNAIANGGVYVAPRLVSEIVEVDGERRKLDTPDSRVVVTEDAARATVDALIGVLDDGGTGEELALEGFNVAGKTGTAYKVRDDGTGYGNSTVGRDYAASFVGFFPASDPEITIMVMLDEPESGQHTGARAAGPVFQRLAMESIRRFSIAGDEPSTTGSEEPLRAVAAPPTTTTTIPTEVVVAPPTTVADTTTTTTTIAGRVDGE